MTEYAVMRVARTSMGNTHTDTDSAIEQKNAREDDNLLSGGISRSDRPSLVKLPFSGVEITGKEVIDYEDRITNAELKANLGGLSLSAGKIRSAQSSRAELRDEEGISVGKLEINKEIDYPGCNPSSVLLLLTIQSRHKEVNGWLTHAIPAADELDNSSALSQGDSCEPVLGVIELISITIPVDNDWISG